MPPPMQKRKRNERTYSTDNVNQGRPSPHRPENLSLANGAGRNGRRQSRGGRGGAVGNTQNSTAVGQTAAPAAAFASSSPAANFTTTMKPPQQPTPQIGAKSAQETASQQARTRTHPPGMPPKLNPSIDQYEYFTTARVRSWEDSGRQELMDDVHAKARDRNLQELGLFFQELIYIILDDAINPQDAGTLSQEILEQAESAEFPDAASLLLDNISVVLDKSKLSGKEETFQLFLQSTGIDGKLIGMVLDVDLLAALGIVSNTFPRMGIRHSTNVLYRQSGFNLLREESEGYSKLMTEFFTITHNFKADRETIEMTWQKVKALIGAFDLDVGRVLDIMLDVFANNIIRHNKFFIRLLMVSDWWPKAKSLVNFFSEGQSLNTLPPWANINYSTLEVQAEDAENLLGLRHSRDVMFWERAREVGMQAFFELGGRRAIPKHTESVGNKQNMDEDAAGDDDWAEKTKTYPPSGNWNAAQILGFKLRFYASDARDSQDRLTDNVVWLAALLIKIGFISLKDLYPHIYPTDDMMDDVKSKLEKDKEERLKKLRPGGGSNALTMAGALADGDAPGPPLPRALQDTKPRSSTPLRTEAGATPAVSTPSQDEVSKSDQPVLPEAVDQKILLLKSLLLVGAIPDALYILSRFPWLIDLSEELPKYIFRILHHMLKKVYFESQPVAGRYSDTSQGSACVEINNQIVLEPRREIRSIAWGQLEKMEWAESDYGTRYRFYWDEWNDLVPVCQNVDDVFALCDTFLNLVGHKIGTDSELLSKLMRIGVRSLNDDESQDNHQRWQKLAKRLLIPALSLTKENPGTVNEAWELLKLFPVAVRYNIYAEWFGGQTSRLPDIRVEFDISKARTKDVLKRISLTNIKAMARSLAKVAYLSPGVALQTTFNQIEAYNNLIEVVIDCVRYFTYIGFDVLIWSLLTSLGSGSRNRMQADGMLMSKWLQRLAEFTGKVSKRYYKDLDLKPLLLYVNDQLGKGNSTDLGVLSSMVEHMGGIRAGVVYTEEQMIALSGRPLLRAATLKRIGDSRHLVKSSSAKLAEALSGTHLAGRLLVLIALERQQYLERESSSGAPIKVLSTNLMQLQKVFVQYLEFLRGCFTIQEFDSMMPVIEGLIGEHGVEPAIAFTIMRPSIQAQLDQVKVARAPNDDDKEMADTANAQMSPGPTLKGSSMKDDSEMGEVTQTDPLHTSAVDGMASESIIHPALQQLADRLRAILPSDFEERMSMSFYVRFWQSSLSDVLVPSYDIEIKSVKARFAQVANDRSDMSISGAKKKEARKKEIQQAEKALQDEWKAALSHHNTMKKTLVNERVLWFENFPPTKHDGLANAIVQECLLPRIILSEMDALFTAKFIFFVHKSSTPGFRLGKLLPYFFNEQRFIALLFMMTESEAKYLGIFLKETLAQLRLWRDSKVAYDREGCGPNNENTGFAKTAKIRDDNTIDGLDQQAVTSHAAFQRLLFSWHGDLHKAIQYCLESGEYNHIRNAASVLQYVHEQFPAINYQGRAIEAQVIKLSREDPRDDLKLVCLSLLSTFKKSRHKWISAPQFRPGAGDGGQIKAKTDERNADTRPTTPLPTSAKALSAAAAEFQPTAFRKPSSAGEEDGEIDDSREVATATTSTQASAEVDGYASIPIPRPGTPLSLPRAATPSGPSHPVPARPDGKGLVLAGSSSHLPSSSLKNESSRAPAPAIQASGPPSSLPPRPAGPFPSVRDLTRRPDERTSLTPRHEPRDIDQQGRLERPTDSSREAPHRRSRSPARHGRIRSPDTRPPRPEPERRESGYSGLGGQKDYIDPRSGRHPPREERVPRDSRDLRDLRELRNEGHHTERDSRRPEPNAKPAATDERLPRFAETQARDVGTSINPDRVAQFGTVAIDPARAAAIVDTTGMNPARAALFEQDSRPDEQKRRQDDDWRSDRRGRGHAPRDDSRAPPSGSRAASPHSDRRGERAGPERPPRSNARDRRDEDALAPTGPFAARANAEDSQRNRSDLFSGNSGASVETSHSRSSQDASRSQDLSFGRLAPPTATDAPAGPRGRAGGRTLRGAPESAAPSGPRSMAPSSPAMHIPPTSPSSDRAPPSGPANNVRRAAGQAGTAPASAPQGPAAEAIHPGRRLHIETQAALQANASSVPAAGPPIPSGPRSAGGPRAAPSQVTMPPPSPSTTRAPPRGPSSTGGGRDQRILGTINGILNDPRTANTGTNIRGRASIGSAPQSPASSSAPAQESQAQSRPESLADRVEQSGFSGNDDDYRNNSSRRLQRDGERGPRRHRSRSRSPRREAADNAMRARGEMPPQGPPGGPEDRNRRRESGDERDRDSTGRDRRSRGGGGEHGRERDPLEMGRDGGRREPREFRDGRDGRSQRMPQIAGAYGPGGGVPPQPPGSLAGGMNGDIGGRGGSRRDDRERRDDGHRGGDRNKRRRPEDGPPGMHEQKRPRRGQ